MGWLTAGRRFSGEPRFPGLAAIVMVEAEVERAGSVSVARRYYLSSAPLTSAQFARAVRSHWGIENRLHWVMDVVFHDDLMRLRTDHGPANMATMRHACPQPDPHRSRQGEPQGPSHDTRRDEDYLLQTLTQSHP